MKGHSAFLTFATSPCIEVEANDSTVSAGADPNISSEEVTTGVCTTRLVKPINIGDVPKLAVSK